MTDSTNAAALEERPAPGANGADVRSEADAPGSTGHSADSRSATSPGGGSPVLRVADVGVELAGRLVLHNVNLHVSLGELVGLIGPNGAGKTTLLRAILGLLHPVAGDVVIDGRMARPGRMPVGYVPQRQDFDWQMPVSVADVVMTGLTGALGLFRRPGAGHWQAVSEALDRVRMHEFANRPVGQLSGGQRQRVLVARALVLRPSLLLLDEPFTGLDMPTQELLSDLFTGLAREGRAVLMTTHDILAAFDTCDRLVLLNRTVVAQGTPGDLTADQTPWMHTFGVGESSPLLRILKVAR